MELALSLGDHRPSKPFSFLDKTPKLSNKEVLGFCMVDDDDTKRVSSDPPLQLQLDLLPFTPVPRSLPWLPVVAVVDEAEEAAAFSSSPNSADDSSLQMDFVFKNGSKRVMSTDDDENGSTRKKLRLSKEQSVFLEESFKEHNTLINPKQKLALAKQLNLRPRQIEVWFQNRRARTKLKQTEVDCEYLKRCCETLAEENKRLKKELLELRALKTSQQLHMQRPATTLTMCPSCERVATANVSVSAVSAVTAGGGSNNDVKTEGYQCFPSSTN